MSVARRTFRPTWRQTLLIPAALLLGQGIAFVVSAGGFDLNWSAVGVRLLVTLPALLLAVLIVRSQSTTLTTEGIAYRRIFRKVLPWGSVEDITTTRAFGDGAVTVLTTDARRIALPAPTVGLWFSRDRNFETKAEEIIQWWKTGDKDASGAVLPDWHPRSKF